MKDITRIPIEKDHLRRAAELARQCSAAAVRERVLVAQSAAWAMRDYLSREFNIVTGDGRSAQSKFVELLDVCDFSIGGWRVETRAAVESEQPILHVPTMPLMVGLLSDFYLSVEVDRNLTVIKVIGFARRAGLASADLSANGLFALLPSEELLPFARLTELLREERLVNEDQIRLFDEWQDRAARIIKGVSEVLAVEGTFTPDQLQLIAGGLRDDVWRAFGDHLPGTGLKPLYESLFRRFGIASPVPAKPTDQIAFQNSVEQLDVATNPQTQAEFLQETLSVGERVALYRHLLEDESVLNDIRRLRRALDRATGGKHQASRERRDRIQQLNLRRAQTAGLEPEPVPTELLLEIETIVNQARQLATAGAGPSPNPSPNGFMNIFDFRNRLIADYASYVKSFIQLRNNRVREYVEQQLSAGVFYPDPLIQLNPSFARGETIEELVAGESLHPECANIFRKDKADTVTSGRPLNLHQHQAEAIHAARKESNYVLTTGTGSGKSLAYIIPIVNHVLRQGSGRGIQAIVVYPMNALANSQFGELEKFLCFGYPDGAPVTFDKYTGQENVEERERILRRPPDILLTNYVMLELILTRPAERKIIEAAQGLRFLVLDELHTYRGRQGADVALLVRRVRDRLQADQLQCVGTSATIAGGGGFEEQRAEVATVATQLFGAEVRPEGVIMETLRRTTPARDLEDRQFIADLKARIADVNGGQLFPNDYAGFINDPLAIWIESTLGVELKDGRLVRCQPQSIISEEGGEEGAAKKLAALTGIDRRPCEIAIQRALLAGYECEKNPETGFAPFAFRLHQFISRGDTVYATLEDEQTRHLTIYGQQFKPGSREHVLLPLVFCRECGQEYYSVRRFFGTDGNHDYFTERQLNDQLSDEKENQAGFLYFSTDRPFPGDEAEIINDNRIPDDWLEERNGKWRVRKDRQDQLPRPITVGTDGVENPDGMDFSYLAAPFRFCLCCGVAYGMRQRDDFAKLSSLGSEGRSTATTITSLSAVRSLRRSSLPERARKLLSFTDNRQDASLQAGHFNDFIETMLLRSALYHAVSDAGQRGQAGVSYDELTGKVYDALKLPRALYSKNPDEKFQNIKDTDRALREVIGYRLYRDLERGWRITMPNLEQCGLLQIEYQSLDELCEVESEWINCHQALTTASPETRRKIAKKLFVKLSGVKPL